MCKYVNTRDGHLVIVVFLQYIGALTNIQTELCLLDWTHAPDLSTCQP